MSYYDEAIDGLVLIDEAKLSVDQLLELAKVRALLAITEELSKIYYKIEPLNM